MDQRFPDEADGLRESVAGDEATGTPGQHPLPPTASEATDRTTRLDGVTGLPERGAASSGKRLGRIARMARPSSLMAADFLPTSVTEEPPPAATHFWDDRKPFEPRSFGNTQYGSCTRSKQANAIRRMERIEVRRTPAIADQEVIDRYLAMTTKYYPPGGDTGAYEEDALNCWRDPEQTIHDTKGRALTIDAYLRVASSNLTQVKQTLAAAQAHGLAFCIALPWAFNAMNDGDWDVPAGQPLIGDWQPYSWGGHSMWAIEYDEVGVWAEHTWNRPPQRITWRAWSAYVDEAHLVIDKLDYWRSAGLLPSKTLKAIREAVNDVSRIKIAA